MAKPVFDYLREGASSVGALLERIEIVGAPIYLEDGSVLLPLSRVSFAFGNGGCDLPSKKKVNENEDSFGALLLGGVHMIPEGFLFIQEGECSMIWLEKREKTYQKALDIIRILLEKKKNGKK